MKSRTILFEVVTNCLIPQKRESISREMKNQLQHEHRKRKQNE